MNVHEKLILTKTYKAEVAMTTKYIAVKLGTDDDEVNIAGDGESAIGVTLSTAPTAGDSVSVCLLGICAIKAHGAFSKGDILNSGASTGKVDTAGTTELGTGIALEAATAQDDEVSCLVCPVYKV